MAVIFRQGHFWNSADDLTGPTGMTNLNASEKGGLVWAVDSFGLFIIIERLDYIFNFAYTTFPGTALQAVPANSSVFVYLNNTGALVINNTGFPVSGWYYALALLLTNSTNVIFITNVGQPSPGGTMGSGVASVGATAPITSSGGATPNIGIVPATPSIPGSMSATDKTKLNEIEAGAEVTSTAKVSAAGALMKSIFSAALGELLCSTAVDDVPAILPPGVVGTFLQRIAGAPGLTWAAIAGTTIELLVARASALTADAGAGVNAYEWTLIFKTGACSINGINPHRIDVPTAGQYIALVMNRFSKGAGAGSHIVQGRSPIGTPVGRSLVNPGAVGAFDCVMFTLAPFVIAAANQLLIEATLAGTAAFPNVANEDLLLMLKVG